MRQDVKQLSYEILYSFLKRIYKECRFEGRNQAGYMNDYSHCVTASTFNELLKYGYGLVTAHSSINGLDILFTANDILNKDINEILSQPKLDKGT